MKNLAEIGLFPFLTVSRHLWEMKTVVPMMKNSGHQGTESSRKHEKKKMNWGLLTAG